MLASRWLHVIVAVVLVGGTVFMRYVVLPAAADLPEEEHNKFRDRLTGRWKRFVHGGIGLLLLSGFYNYIAIAIPAHKGDGLYHAIMGTKIILAFIVFFIASALVGKSAAFEKLRENRKKWLSIAVLLGVLIIAMAGFLKVREIPVKTADAPTPAATE